MNEAAIRTFTEAIHTMHGAKASRVATKHVSETSIGEPVWEGNVLIFDLVSHATAKLCYAWEVNGEITADLGERPRDSALAAVRASIEAGTD